jgi:hypothetical protein
VKRFKSYRRPNVDKQLVADLRKEFDELVEVLEGDGFCTKRECMCDHAKPVVKMNDLITKLEQEQS